MVPPSDFLEDDFIAMFDPAGKVQGSKLREAIKSLRLAKLCPDIFPLGYVPKISQTKELFNNALNKNGNYKRVDEPSEPFDGKLLANQIKQEYHKTAWNNETTHKKQGVRSNVMTRPT